MSETGTDQLTSSEFSVYQSLRAKGYTYEEAINAALDGVEKDHDD